jgi:hypothetical protein
VSSDPDAQQRDTAGLIERDNPGWMVIFGRYSRRYWAYPLFPVPTGTVVGAASPADLVTRMREVENAYGGPLVS